MVKRGGVVITKRAAAYTALSPGTSRKLCQIKKHKRGTLPKEKVLKVKVLIKI